MWVEFPGPHFSVDFKGKGFLKMGVNLMMIR